MNQLINGTDRGRETDNIDCVILAAGKSERMGRWKMALPCGSSTIIETTVGSALRVCSRVLLVAGFNADTVAKIFRDNTSVEVVCNPEYETGMFSSVQRGCREVATKRFFLTLGDMPLVRPETYGALLPYTAAEVIIPKYRGKRGHPILLGSAMAYKIADYNRDKTLHHVLADVVTMSIPVDDEAVVQDIDTEDDYERIVSS